MKIINIIIKITQIIISIIINLSIDKMNFHLFLFLFFLFKTYEKKLVLPFKTMESTKGEFKDEFMGKLYYNNIYVNISFGSPPQKFPLCIKLQQLPTYITDISVEGNFKKFKSNESNSYKQLSFYKNVVTFHPLDGYISNDSILFNNINIEKFNFVVATELSKNYDYYSGELGLKLYDKYASRIIPFIDQLKNNDLIDKYYFTLRYKNNDEGDLIIGELQHEYDKNYISDNFTFSKIGIEGYEIGWFFHFDDVYFGNIDINSGEDNRYNDVIFSYELGLIIGTYDYKIITYKNFFEKLLNEKKCYEKQLDLETIFYVCDKDVDITKFENLIFYSKKLNFNITLTYEDLFLKHDNQYYFLVIFRYYKQRPWEFGKPFFKKYEAIFDKDTKTVGFYTIKYNRRLNKTVLSLIFVIFCLIILLGISSYIIYRFIKNKPRKIRANELEEGFDYTIQNNQVTPLLK